MQIRKHAENCSYNYFGLFALLNSFLNEIIQTKGCYYNVLLRQVPFPTNIGNYINSQSNFVFIQNSIIIKKTCPTKSFLYYQVIKNICKTGLLKGDITQKMTSVFTVILFPNNI